MVTNEEVALRALRAGSKIIRDAFGHYKMYHRTTSAELSQALFQQLVRDGKIEKSETKPEHFVEMWAIKNPASASQPGS